jgi:hypothetical protein
VNAGQIELSFCVWYGDQTLQKNSAGVASDLCIGRFASPFVGRGISGVTSAGMAFKAFLEVLFCQKSS